MDHIKKLQAKREELAAKMRAMNDAGKADGIDQEAWDAISAEYDGVMADLKTSVAEYEAAQARQTAIDNRMSQLAIDAKLGGDMLLGRDNGRIGDSGAIGTQQPVASQAANFNLALQAWYAVPCENAGQMITDAHRQAAQACGINLASSNLTLNLGTTDQAKAMARRVRFQNALATQDGQSGGFLLDESFVGNLELAMSAYGGVLQVADIIRTPNANPLRWPTGDDTSNTGEQVGENTTVDGSTEPTLAQQTWNAYKMSSKMVKVGYELLRDSPVNLASTIGDMLGVRLGRIQNTKYTTGTGAATPKGIVTGATAGITATSGTAIVTDELLGMIHSIDPAIRSLGCSWMLNDGILLALRKLKDGNGNYIWQSGTVGGAPDSLFGYPLTINQDMQATVATTTVTMLFGKMSAYKVRQVGSIRLKRLDERYAELDQVAFIAFLECDGDTLDPGDNPIKKLTQA